MELWAQNSEIKLVIRGNLEKIQDLLTRGMAQEIFDFGDILGGKVWILERYETDGRGNAMFQFKAPRADFRKETGHVE